FLFLFLIFFVFRLHTSKAYDKSTTNGVPTDTPLLNSRQICDKLSRCEGFLITEKTEMNGKNGNYWGVAMVLKEFVT
ncbi:MAG: hypothetical protein II899_03110, partial [Bacteroidales bacterium]|nr:hypothetical protein [Bacteroidales bacterium]